MTQEQVTSEINKIMKDCTGKSIKILGGIPTIIAQAVKAGFDLGVRFERERLKNKG